jgi:hemoglobin
MTGSAARSSSSRSSTASTKASSTTPARALYPADLEPGKANLAGFLAQHWGGPPEYSARRGHPRLRMRHFRFAIGPRERDAWVRHMVAAVRASDAAPDDAQALVEHFEGAATMLVNQPG